MPRVKFVFQALHQPGRGLVFGGFRAPAIINHAIARPGEERNSTQVAEGFDQSRGQNRNSTCRRPAIPEPIFVIEGRPFRQTQLVRAGALPLDFFTRAGETYDQGISRAVLVGRRGQVMQVNHDGSEFGLIAKANNAVASSSDGRRAWTNSSASGSGRSLNVAWAMTPRLP